MSKLLRLISAALVCGFLGACGGGDEPPIAAVPARADIGVDGGSLEATLEGGTVVRLTVPAGALKRTTTIRIDPVTAPAGTLGAFDLSPAGLDFDPPASLQIIGAPGTDVTADSTLAIERSTGLGPMAAQVDSAKRTVTLQVRRFSIDAATASTSAAVRERPAALARPSDAAADALRMFFINMDYNARVAALLQGVATLARNTTPDDALYVQLAMVRGTISPDAIDLHMVFPPGATGTMRFIGTRSRGP